MWPCGIACDSRLKGLKFKPGVLHPYTVCFYKQIRLDNMFV